MIACASSGWSAISTRRDLCARTVEVPAVGSFAARATMTPTAARQAKNAALWSSTAATVVKGRARRHTLDKHSKKALTAGCVLSLSKECSVVCLLPPLRALLPAPGHLARIAREPVGQQDRDEGSGDDEHCHDIGHRTLARLDQL